MSIKKILVCAGMMLLSASMLFSADQKGAPLTDGQKKWMDEVFYIISDYEKNAYLSLKTDAERDQFVKAFWENRDPTPGTEKNEFKDEHYTRFAYATKQYGRDTTLPGWKTDRGRIWILFGKPEFIKRDAAPFDFYPMELWQYAGYKGYGVPSSIYFLFFQEKGVGTYKLYSPLSDGIKSLFVMHSENVMKTDQELYDVMQQEFDPEIAHAAYSSLPTVGGYPGDASSGQMASELIQSKVFNAKNYELEKRKYVEDFIHERPRVDVYTNMDTSGIRDGVFWFQAQNGNYYVDYAVEYEPDKLDMGQYEDYYTSLTMDGSVSTDDKIEVLQIAGTHEIKLTQAQFDKVKNMPFQYQGRKPIIAGKYDMTLIVNNNVSRHSMTFSNQINIPDPSTQKDPVITPVMPLRTSEKATANDNKIRPFQHGDLINTPNLAAKYTQHSSMPVYHQVIFPVKFEPGPGALVLHYLVSSNGTVEAEASEPLNLVASDLAGNAVDIRKDVPLSGTTLGNKQLIVELRLNDKVLARSEPATITVESQAPQGVWTFAVAIPNFDSVYHSYELSQQLLKLKRTSQALTLLEQASKEHPDSMEVNSLLMRAALKSAQYQRVIDLGSPLEVKSPRDKELLWLLGWANYGLKKYDDAVRFFERLRIEDPSRIEVLNLLADIYFRLDQKDKSLERVQQSLALKPDQKDILDLKQKLQPN